MTAGVLVAGCAATNELVPMASADLDAKAKTFSTKRGKAVIYVYRNQANIGPNARMSVVLNGDTLGKTVAKSYVIAEVEPGKHTLESKAENDSRLEIEAQAGKNYFVRQVVSEGTLSARTRLQLVDDTTGKAGVRECQLIETN
jgi:tryptophan synthase beta subunit